MAAAWLVPGLGHVLLGRVLRGAAYFVIVTTAFATGLALHGRLHTFDPEAPLTLLAAAASYGAGVLNIGARAAGLGTGDLRAATYEYGTTYLVSAAIMNVLLVLDAFDVARARKP